MGGLTCYICISTRNTLSSSFQTAKALGMLVFTAVSCCDDAVEFYHHYGTEKKNLLLFSSHFPHKKHMWHFVYVDASVMRKLVNVGRESSFSPVDRGSC